MPTPTTTYHTRSLTHPTSLARTLLTIIHTKRTNLCLSIDLTSPSHILSIISTLGPKLCLVKTHIDIITFPLATPSSPNPIQEFTASLTALSKKHNFLIFEDRKFADIGNTVISQYTGGVYNISSWAHIVNAHALPGEGIVKGLQAGAESSEGGLENRALLLLYEMSSAGNLFTSAYKQSTLDIARRNKGWVMGFISMGAIPQSPPSSSEGEGVEEEREDFITMTPGVNITSTGDSLGQQYKTPEYVIGEMGSDIIIVGRGIYKNEERMVEVAEEYRRRGWEAYERRAGGA